MVYYWRLRNVLLLMALGFVPAVFEPHQHFCCWEKGKVFWSQNSEIVHLLTFSRNFNFHIFALFELGPSAVCFWWIAERVYKVLLCCNM